MGAIFLFSFWAFLIGALFLAWKAGDRPDRQLVIAIVLAALVSLAINALFDGRAAAGLITLVDVTLLWLVSRYAVKGNRYWPLWFAGCQGAIVMLDLAAWALTPTAIVRFDLIAGFWSVAAISIMVIGIVVDQRRGITAT